MRSIAKRDIILVLLHHLEAIHDRPDRADQIVTNPRAQQRGEIEAFEHDGTGHCAPSPDSGDDSGALGDSAVEREPPM
jgi:hypothetical protein